jgi:hypothetical protein
LERRGAGRGPPAEDQKKRPGFRGSAKNKYTLERSCIYWKGYVFAHEPLQVTIFLYSEEKAQVFTKV